MKITFLGGVGTVTGSKYLIETENRKILVDCGLFQGYKQLRLRNWAPLPIDPAAIDTVVLTHAHLDHSGYLPVLVRNGFAGRVVSTLATRDLCQILLSDSGHLQEREAEFASRHGFSKHHPAQPLYTQREAEASMARFDPLDYEIAHDLGDGLTVRLFPAGHILGSAFVQLTQGGRSILFTGDLGRPNDPTMLDPTVIRQADYLVLESTYGNRRHDRTDPEDALAAIINRTAHRGGAVLIPAFAVGRSQSILFHLHRLKEAGRIVDIPVFLDSPMAINASETFCQHFNAHRLTKTQCRVACNVARYVRTAEDSMSLDENPMPMILISASGMATGGRILHHLKHFAPDHRNTILFTGFQAGGTRGAAMIAGAESVKIHGGYVPIRAEVQNLDMLSAHADSDEIMAWLNHFEAAPRTTFISHGEPDASDALRHRIEEEIGWTCVVPDYKDQQSLA
ncbi:MAG: MBL fold metallo-hydrolase [Rhodospirillaceae bacterium]|nr:MBL fold metallo-hydrolase [Rhodospirillaceae bacterium]MBT5666772.1 MBL fold metallo-hydrolase [Rhodospirillaceae bacterium]MBT5812609.1 MBL fold metallo-hydrolase [Rhodospirillaceae bacterium]